MLLKTLALSTVVLTPYMAVAQTAPAVTPSDEEASPPDGDAIVVTAQRREQLATDIPASVVAFSGDALLQRGVVDSRDLGLVTPGLTIAPQGANAQPTLRGVGTAVNGPGNPPNIAVYIDGVYQTSQLGNTFNFNSFDRVEVLKGPQGVLYGRNATGGAILITTKRPKHELEGDFSLSYGSFNEIQSRAYISGGLSENLAANLAVLYRTDDGYMRNIFTRNRAAKSKSYSIRGELLFTPIPGLEALLILDKGGQDTDTGYASHIINNNSSLRNRPGVILPTDPYEISQTFDPHAIIESEGATFNMSYDFSGLTLRSVSGYRKITGDILTDSDYTSFASIRTMWTQVEDVFSEELTLSSNNGDRFNWIVGGYIATENNKYDPYINNGVELRSNTKTLATSGFVNGEFAATDRLHVELGARYSYERKHFTAIRPASGVTRDATDSWTAFTPQASVRYEFADNSNIYASYRRGFKSGSFAGTAFLNTAYAPEEVDGYEVGVKSRLARGLHVEAAAFLNKYRNVQVLASTASTVPGAPASQVLNAASETIKGAEASFNYTPVRGLTLTGGVNYLDARYNSFPNALITTPLPAGGNSQLPGDATGNRVVRVPEWTTNSSVSYTYDLPDSSKIQATANLYTSSSFFGDFGNRLREPSYHVLNARLGYTLPGDNLTISVWGRNLTDEVYASLVLDSANNDRVIYARPRTYGVSLDAKF